MMILAAEIVIVMLLFMANGLFAMMEMAVVSSRKSRLRQMAEAGDAKAQVALELADAPGRFLPTVQIGITLIGLLAGAFSGITFAEMIAGWLKLWPAMSAYADAVAVIVVVTALTFLSLVVGELVPKRLALADPEGVACRLARPVEWLSRAAAPFIHLLGVATDLILKVFKVRTPAADIILEDEVKLLLRDGQASGVFHHAEPQMVESVLAFDTRPVLEIMTPQASLVCVHVNDTHDDIWHKIVVSRHSSYPVYDRNRDDVIGVVDVKAVYANLAAGVKVVAKDLMNAPLFVTASDPILHVLEQFKATGRHIALVRDAQEQIVGLVTLVDVLEAIVGDIPANEDRHRPKSQIRPDGAWMVDGGYDLAKLDAGSRGTLLTNPLPRGTTAARFVSLHLGQEAREGDAFIVDSVRFEIIDMDFGVVDKVLITPMNHDTTRAQPQPSTPRS